MTGLATAGQRILAATLNEVAQIATATLAVSAASVTFSSIPAFNHLSLRWHAAGDAVIVGEQINMQVNGVTTTNYVGEKLECNTTTVTGTLSTGTTSAQIGTIPGSSRASGYMGAGVLEMPGIQDAANHQAYVAMATAIATNSVSYVGLYAGMLAAGTAPITTLTLFPNSGNFIAGSQFSLYGWM